MESLLPSMLSIFHHTLAMKKTFDSRTGLLQLGENDEE